MEQNSFVTDEMPTSGAAVVVQMGGGSAIVVALAVMFSTRRVTEAYVGSTMANMLIDRFVRSMYDMTHEMKIITPMYSRVGMLPVRRKFSKSVNNKTWS